MSLIFTLKSYNHILSIDFSNPIELEPESNYGLALIGFYSYNSIPNIEEGGNKFYYKDSGSRKTSSVTVPVGSYEIADIENYLKKKIIPETITNIDQQHKYISIKPNNNTLKCEIQSDRLEVDFTPADSIARILGYSKQVLPPKQVHESDLTVNIVKVRTIHIDCNITTGAFYNQTPSHTIYEFSLDVDPGFAINEIPKNLIYLPIINKREIANITLNILDQNFCPVDFRNEEVIIRLELKKII